MIYFNSPELLIGSGQAYNLPFLIKRAGGAKTVVAASESLWRIYGKKLLKTFYNFEPPCEIVLTEKPSFEFSAKVGASLADNKAGYLVAFGDDELIDAAISARYFADSDVKVAALAGAPLFSAGSANAYVKLPDEGKIKRVKSEKTRPDTVIIDERFFEISNGEAKNVVAKILCAAACGIGKDIYRDRYFCVALNIAVRAASRILNRKSPEPELADACCLAGIAADFDGEFGAAYEQSRKSDFDFKSLFERLSADESASEKLRAALELNPVYGKKRLNSLKDILDIL